jgi:Mrp family chromosome partitioning ATPase
MYQRRSELVRQISGLDPQHPGYQQIKKQLERIEDEVVDATNQLTTEIKHMLVEDRRSKVVLSERIETDLLTQITEQKNRASWFSTSYNDALSLNQEIKRFYEQLETVDNRISFLELESKAPGFIHIESPARSPEIPIRGGRKKLFIMAFVLSILAFFGIPIGIDMLDKRIKTAGQVEKLLGYKPLTALVDPGQKSEQNEAESARMLANQMRHLVLTLERERSQTDKPYNLIMLTAVEPKSAVTSLALNLAMDYRKIDVPVIVVEVNSLTPDQRYLSKPNAAGLLNVAIDDELSITDVINPADNHYPDRIALGTTTTELLFGYHRIESLLTKIAETYPVIILDTAPILNSADTEFFASISDITLLLIAAKETKPDRIKLAVQLLERIDPKIIGFVVTRLEIFIGGWRPLFELVMSFLKSKKQPLIQLNRLGKK